MNGRDLGALGRVGDALEDAGAVEPREQLARGGAAVLVEHGVGHVVEIVGRGVAEIRHCRIGGTNRMTRLRGSLRTASSSLRIRARMRRSDVEHARLRPSFLRVTARAASEQHRRHHGEHRRVRQDHAPDVAGEEDRLQQRDEIARRAARR